MSVVQFMRLDNILKLLNEGAINQTFCKMIDRLRKFRRKYAEGDHSGGREIYRECCSLRWQQISGEGEEQERSR